MPYFRSVLILVATLLFLAGSYVAEAMTINFDTKPADMTGMQVTATYITEIDDTEVLDYETLTWGNLKDDYWGVRNENFDWSLTMYSSTSTWTNSWVFSSNLNIIKLSIGGLNGNTVFDIFNYSYGTQDSYLGYAFSFEENKEVENRQIDPISEIQDQSSISLPIPDKTNLYVNAAYKNPVISTQDLYSTLELTFYTVNSTNQKEVAVFDGELFFYADTDTINPVPEPGTLLLFGAGLLGLSAAVRRR